MKRYSKLVLLILVFISLVGIVKIQRVMNDDLYLKEIQKAIYDDLNFTREKELYLYPGSYSTLTNYDNLFTSYIRIKNEAGPSWIKVKILGPHETIIAEVNEPIEVGETSDVIIIPYDAGEYVVDLIAGKEGNYKVLLYNDR